MSELDATSWINQLTVKLQDAFGERLHFVGIQGSRARGEAQPDSDIDSVVLIENLTANDIITYRKIVATMPHHEIACGFIGSPDVLAAWPRYDAFNLVMDTKQIFGTFDFMNTTFTAADAIQSARAGASEIYHAISHTIAFEPETLPQVVDACIKSSFFVMRALCYAETNEYPNSRQRMKELASPEELVFLESYKSSSVIEPSELASQLLEWTESVIEQVS